MAAREARTGAWSDINIDGSTTAITRNFLTLWFEHGANPTNATYAYTLLPNRSAAEVADFATLRKYLADDRIDQVAFSVLKHLAIYATGRNLTYRELEFLRQDGLRLKPAGYRMKDMIRYVATSPIFLEK